MVIVQKVLLSPFLLALVPRGKGGEGTHAVWYGAPRICCSSSFLFVFETHKSKPRYYDTTVIIQQMHGDAYRLAELHGAVMPLMRRRHLSTRVFRPLSYRSFTRSPH